MCVTQAITVCTFGNISVGLFHKSEQIVLYTINNKFCNKEYVPISHHCVDLVDYNYVAIQKLANVMCVFLLTFWS